MIGSVVDAGCGTGYGVACLARLFPSKRFVGADYSEAGVALARRTHASLPNARFVVLDLTAAETLEVARFDAALSFDVIEHIADYDRYVDGLDRVLSTPVRKFGDVFGAAGSFAKAAGLRSDSPPYLRN